MFQRSIHEIEVHGGLRMVQVLLALLISGLCAPGTWAASRQNSAQVCSPMMGFCDRSAGEGQLVQVVQQRAQFFETSQRVVLGRASNMVDYGTITSSLSVRATGKGLQFTVGLSGETSGRYNDLIAIESDVHPVGTPVQILVDHRVDAVITKTGVVALPSGNGVGGDLGLASTLSLAVYRNSGQISFQDGSWCSDASGYVPIGPCADSFGGSDRLRVRLVVRAQVGDKLELSSELYAAAFAAQETEEDLTVPVALNGFATTGPSRSAISRVKLKPSLSGIRLVGESGKLWSP